MRTIDISADLGESAPDEDAIWPLITSANVACGGHIGDAASMREAAERAQVLGVRLGAHPSYPDRANFGRVSLSLPPDTLRASLISQIESLRAFAPLHHVKPHGALYNDAHRDYPLAEVVISALQGLAIVCPDHSQMAAAARAAGVPVIREAFADRRYEPDGSLMSRKLAGSLLTVEEAAAQAALLVSEGAVIARDGTRVPIAFDTICIHADMADALPRLRAVHARIRNLSRSTVV
ncbi:MAG TPA: LamB/YcsF family protein [Thermoanaerobaculia bacterium]|nr:LamB/YcsF family protein [Thermoanaerobaculia bacterium]